MHIIIPFILIFFFGFFAAIPAGPVQVEVIKRSIRGHLMPSLVVIFGAFIVDFFYGAVAIFGIVPFLERPAVASIFWVAGSIILCILGIITIRHSRNADETGMKRSYLQRKSWSFLSGVSLSVTNPVMILWWLSSLKIFTDMGVMPVLTTSVAVMYLLSGSLGLASYLLLVSLMVHMARDFIPLRKMRQITFVMGVFLLLLSGYFMWQAVRTFIR